MRKIISLIKYIINLSTNSYRPEFDKLSRDDLSKLLDGYIHMLHRHETTPDFNAALIDAYVKTSGKFQEYVHEVERKKQNDFSTNESLIVELPNKFGSYFSVNDEVKGLHHVRITEQMSLERDGYEIMPFTIEGDVVDRIHNELVNFDYRIKTIDDKVVHGDYDSTLNGDVVTAFALRDQVINNPTVRGLFLDSQILKSVREYLGCPQIRLRDVNLWLSRAQSKPSSESAQLYHFDQASIKWVKVFIFLTDVYESNGPHCAILGSHIPGSKPWNLLKKGYVRIPDEDIFSAYGQQRERKFFVNKGDVLLADTNAWHKGSVVNEGYRLVLEFEYTACIEQGHSAQERL